MDISDESVKIAIAVRTARAVFGWNQQELADKFKISKPTIARLETLEMQPKAELISRLLRYFRDCGVHVDPIFNDELVIKVEMRAVIEAKARLMDDNLRRADRKKRSAGSRAQNQASRG